MENGESDFNRLVLIGNGFDLALGLKTGYGNFILWLLKKYFVEASKCGKFRVHKSRNYSGGYLNNESFEIGIRNNHTNLSYEVETSKIESIQKLRELWQHYSIDFKIKSRLINQIIKHNDDLGWVDIETIFYQELKSCIDKKSKDIVRLNSELDFLSCELELYLSEIEGLPVGWKRFGDTVCSQLTQKIDEKELAEESLLNKDKLPDTLYFLNFNYTNAFYNLTQKIDTWRHFTKNINPEWNPIHGQINNPEAPIIFGFGDESDKDYERIENLNNNTLFEHIKSFKYSQTSNYQHLIRFLDSANFQVFIYGHSCGLSDRTMLKEIFEHQNCKSIKVFYYKRPDGSDDFLEKTMEISRHFSDKALMRRKVVNKELSQSIPQNGCVSLKKPD